MDLSAQDVIGFAISGLLTLLWFDIRSIRKEGTKFITKPVHDENCALKLDPIKEDLAEIKQDIKELLRHNGGSK